LDHESLHKFFTHLGNSKISHHPEGDHEFFEFPKHVNILNSFFALNCRFYVYAMIRIGVILKIYPLRDQSRSFEHFPQIVLFG